MGQPTAIYVHGFDLYADEARLPSIEEMSELVDDFTGSMSLKDHLEEMLKLYIQDAPLSKILDGLQPKKRIRFQACSDGNG